MSPYQILAGPIVALSLVALVLGLIYIGTGANREPEGSPPEPKSVHFMECEDVGSDISRCVNDEIVCYITGTSRIRDMDCSTDIIMAD